MKILIYTQTDKNYQGKRTKFSSIYNCLKNDDHPGCPAGTGLWLCLLPSASADGLEIKKSRMIK
jgi:hypothetical protein